MWKWINRGLLIIIILLLILGWQWPKERLELTFCNVGQGDATLVAWGKYQMLVDGGPDNSVLSCLGKNMAFWDRKIELVVVTHPQADHMTGIIEVLRRYQVDKIMMSQVENNTPEVVELKRVISERQVEWGELFEGDKLKLGEVTLKVLYPFNKGPTFVKDVNEVSAVLWGSYGKFDFLLTGDAEERVEDVLRLTERLKEVEVLKVGHHGSKTSSSEKFINIVRPKLAVISVGKNSFGHPTEEVLERLKALGSRVMRTDQDGAVKVISDGKNWWIK